MSGINCGVYPIPTTEDAVAEIALQETEYIEVTDVYAPLEELYNDLYNPNFIYDQSNYESNIGNAVISLNGKSVSQYYTSVSPFDIVVQNSFVTIFTNPYVTTNSVSYYSLFPLAITLQDTDLISGVRVVMYVTGLLYGSITHDFGNTPISSTDINKTFVSPFAYRTAPNEPQAQNYWQARVYSSSGTNLVVSVTSQISTTDKQ